MIQLFLHSSSNVDRLPNLFQFEQLNVISGVILGAIIQTEGTTLQVANDMLGQMEPVVLWPRLCIHPYVISKQMNLL